jgi:hypothetical protein
MRIVVDTNVIVPALVCGEVPFPVKIKINVNGSGQACPLYTGMSTKVDATFVDFTGFQGRGRVE